MPATPAQTDTLDKKQLLKVLKAFRKGDFTVRLPNDWSGIDQEIAEAFNDVVDLNENMAREFARISTVVGKEGKISERAQLGAASGSWAACVNSVNTLIGDMVQPTSEVARVIGAVAKGDLSQTMMLEIDERPLRGEFLRIGKVVNTMVNQLASFASEVTRVAREVGTEGKLGGQAEVKGVAGTWKDLTDNVNLMAANLTGQVRNIAEVTTAVANGDLSKKITVDVKGEILELKSTINTMVDQLNSFASEVSRVAREVGTEGKLGGQAEVKGVGGVWKDLTDNVNAMAGNLTGQVRNIAEVTTAVANGDLSKKITVDVKGEILELKSTINTMVDQLNSFASEVSRVAREVGTEGKLGGQAQVKGVAGTWKDLTDNVNFMAANLTGQVRNIAEVTTAVANGDLSKKITVDVKGEILELKSTINTMVDQLNSFASEVTRVAREVGTDGKLGGQAIVRGVGGVWKDLTDNVNFMAANLTGQVRNIAEVTTAVANGDLSKKITVDVKGEILELKSTINTMVDQLNSFASEVSRVAREVGTEGKLGGQAQVKGVAGTWKDLTDNVNFMAANLTGQVRGIASVVTAVANGDLKRKLAVEAKGEIAALADTINGMIDTLATFADQVTNVAREVGIDGKLGGQAKVPGAAGLWRDLTDNVNQLAANLTTQVRAIAEVATAVTKGDLTRSITVEASGEVAALSDNINEMIRNLRETTQKNNEQDWLKTNLAKFTRMLQGERDLVTVSRMILSQLAPLVNAQHGVFYNSADKGGETALELLASYGYRARKDLNHEFKLGESLVGQCAWEKERILLTNVPSDYIQINSGLGAAAPLNIIVLPVLFEEEVKAVIELASFSKFSETHLSFLDQLSESIGIVLNSIAANMRTEDLLKQSQTLTAELQSQQEELRKTNERLEQQAENLRKSEELLKNQQEELQQTNEELEEKAQMLSEQKAQVELKNKEVEFAKVALEEKAEQLALSSKYKSEFLANMSHELRTPLNSLLILARLLSENPQKNLSDKQVEFAKTIHAAGTDLLGLINDILDLSKIESGTVTLDISKERFGDIAEYVERTFRQVAEDKRLEFQIELDEKLPQALYTDAKRMQQVLKNLLSNAFKFTDKGSVKLSMEQAFNGWNPRNEILNGADVVVAFSVTDTGIGIPADKQKIIFEAFQQADGTTSRNYGGTGLGLSISREIAHLLGGEITVKSRPGKGSVFTFYLPLNYKPDPLADIAADLHDTDVKPVTDTLVPPLEAPLASSFAGVITGAVEAQPATQAVEIDDRANLHPSDRVVLIIENDPNFASILLELAHKKDFKGLIATNGNAGLTMAKRYKPDAVTLDIRLPDMNGWAVLDLLKHDPMTAAIPVHIISVEGQPQNEAQYGAIGFLEKPADPEALEAALGHIKAFIEQSVKSLLVVEDDETQRNSIMEMLASQELRAVAVGTAREAEEALLSGHYDGVVLDLNLPDMPGIDLIEKIRQTEAIAQVPIIVYTARDLNRREKTKLKKLAETVVLKDSRSQQRLLDEITLFLHRTESALPQAKRAEPQIVTHADPRLIGKKVLVVDDDIRNVFALTSVLENQEMNVVYAENGKDAIEMLKNTPDIDIILMDVMMPEMDGYDTMRMIRNIDKFKQKPIIALTAKAMKGDREKCIEAGASDYIAKPVEIEQLISLLRVWLHK